jgi:two-component system phosphate regulon sensor histidine kinase PhoR
MMFDTKSQSPGRIALTIAITSCIFVAGLLIVTGNNTTVILIGTSFFFLLSYFFPKFLIEKYFSRKIKLIYKFINQTKASKREEFFLNKILPKKNLEEVSEEVFQWADQRKAEMELLEKNEAFRKEFLQNLSHEFKTPAFAIQGYLETLISGAMDNPEVSKKFLNNAYKNTERLINLISDLDEITKLESGKQQLHYQQFIIQDLVSEVFDSLMIKTQPKNIKCRIKKGCEQPLSVYADKEKIRQVIINLVDNAIKYGNQEGIVEASIYRTDDKNLLFEISDDGIGIAEEHLLRIFERFYRTDYGRSRNIGGTGLGLAICKHIVEAHGQIIHVRSKPGVGTTFGFTLSKVAIAS